MGIMAYDLRNTKKGSKKALGVAVKYAVWDRFNQIAILENIPRPQLLEKIILEYIPTPAVLKPGEFKSIYTAEVPTLYKYFPHVIVVGLERNGKLGLPYCTRNDFKLGKITKEELTRKYIERLLLPDAQEEIVRLQKIRETNDVYVSSFEYEEEGSLRKMFIEFVNGKLIWK